MRSVPRRKWLERIRRNMATVHGKKQASKTRRRKFAINPREIMIIDGRKIIPSKSSFMTRDGFLIRDFKLVDPASERSVAWAAFKVGDDSALFSNVFVDPKLRRRGVASSLISTQLKEFSREGKRLVFLEIEPFSGSKKEELVKMYLSLGFRPLKKMSPSKKKIIEEKARELGISPKEMQKLWVVDLFEKKH